MNYYYASGSVVHSFADPTESYQFLTPQVAQSFSAILNRDETRYYSLSGTSIEFMSTATFNPAWQSVFKSNGREIVVWNQNGAITKLDIPYIIWIWLRLTPAAKFLRTLWKGTRT